MKKAVVILLVAMMIMSSALMGCADTTAPQGSGDAGVSASASGDAQASAGEDNPAASGKKIGVIFYSKDDALGSTVYSYLNYAAEALGVELMWKLGDLEPTAQITAAENMVSAGVDGILCIPLSEIVTQKISKLCQDNEVYFQICFRTVLDEELKAAVDANPYFVGSVVEDEVGAGEEIIRIMMEDKGCTKFGGAFLPPDNPLAPRNTGLKNGLQKYGGELLGEYTIPADGNPSAHVSGVQNFLSAYPEMDAIVAASASVGSGEAVLNTLNNDDPEGRVTYGTFDTLEGMSAAFEKGTLGVAVGGMAPDAIFSFMMLYNAVNGTPLSDQTEYLMQKYIFISSPEDCKAFEEYVADPNFQIYDAEDIKSMSKAENPDFTLEDMKAMMDEYSIQYVSEKAAERG